MTRPYADKFHKFIEDELNLNEIEATDEEQEEMNTIDLLFETLQEVPMDILIGNMSVADIHLLNSIADVQPILDPVHALVLVMVLYRDLFKGDEPDGVLE